MNRSRFLKLSFLLTLVLTIASPALAADVDVAAKLASQGVLLTLLTVFGAGVLVSLTPCLYPMIPITLSIIGAQSVGKSPIYGFLRSFTFVLGIAVIYTVLAFVAISLGKSVSFLLQYKSFWLVLSIFFIAMGISMLGAFTIQLPARFTGKLQGSTSGKGGFVGAFLIGLVTGIAASPCGSPVLAGLMAFGAQNANRPILIVSLFFSYAFGMGLLFMILGAFPALMKAKPRPGGWMEDVKKFLGLVLIGVGIYYLQQALRGMDALYWGIVVVSALVFGLIVAVKAQSRKGQPRLMLAWRVVGIGLALFAVYAAVVKMPSALNYARTAKSTQPVYTPEKLIAEAQATLTDDAKFTALAKKTEAELSPGSAGGHPAVPAGKQGVTVETKDPAPAPVNAGAPGAPADAHAGWLTDEAVALALAKKEGKPVIIDFGAEWCAACKELEKDTFPDPAVVKALEGFVKVRIDCTEESKENDALQKKYGAASLPTVAFIGKDGVWKKDLTLSSFEKPELFLERLKKVAQ